LAKTPEPISSAKQQAKKSTMTTPDKPAWRERIATWKTDRSLKRTLETSWQQSSEAEVYKKIGVVVELALERSAKTTYPEDEFAMGERFGPGKPSLVSRVSDHQVRTLAVSGKDLARTGDVAFGFFATRNDQPRLLLMRKPFPNQVGDNFYLARYDLRERQVTVDHVLSTQLPTTIGVNFTFYEVLTNGINRMEETERRAPGTYADPTRMNPRI
jgi:hypothetical protein